VKTILPRLTILLLAVASVGAVVYRTAHTMAKTPHEVPPDAGTLPSKTGPTPPGANGQQLMKAAARRAYRQPSVAAKLRLSVELFDQQLVGTGSYMQLGVGEEKLFRLEMGVHTDDYTMFFQQVADGRFLWLRREMDGAVDLGRVDLRRLRGELTDAAPPHAGPDLSAWMALGGLSQLLTGLEANFDFGAPRPSGLASLQILVLEGTWNPNGPASLRADQQKARQGRPTEGDGGDLPPQTPERVRVMLGRDDLFPYRVEYLRRDRPTKRWKTPRQRQYAWKTIALLELYEVNLRAQIDPMRFVYEPDATRIEDRTEAMLESLHAGASAANSLRKGVFP
jgi:hypothetical protein